MSAIHPPRGYGIGIFSRGADGIIGCFRTEDQARQALSEAEIVAIGAPTGWHKVDLPASATTDTPAGDIALDWIGPQVTLQGTSATGDESVTVIWACPLCLSLVVEEHRADHQRWHTEQNQEATP